MLAVESLGIDAVDMPHGTGDVAFRCVNQHVVMVGHETVGGDANIPRFGRILKQFDKSLVVVFV